MRPSGGDSFYSERTFAEALSDIGEKGQREIVRLYHYLCAKHGEFSEQALATVRTRQAVSLVTRSEAFMLGLASPRFAIRMPISTPSGANMGFVQMRRIRRFLKEVERSELIRAPSAGTGATDGTMKDWQQRLGRGSCVADSLLVVPEPIRNGGWTYLTVPEDIKRNYGQAIAEPCVPFMKHIELVGGGMCAQACCFMASLLLYDRVRAVHGIADITALGSSQFRAGEECKFVMSGLSAEGIASFFQNAKSGVTAFYQPAQLTEDPKRQAVLAYNTSTLQLTRRFVDTICAYIGSGFPVIVAVDLGRLAGVGGHEMVAFEPDDVYAQNGLSYFSDTLRVAARERRNHAILVIGYRRRDGDVEFLCQDPAAAPFLTIKGSQLHRLGCYVVHTTEYTKEKEYRDLAVPTGVALLPEAVLMPLLGGKAALQACEGLRTLGPYEAKKLIKSLSSERPDDSFQLMRIKDLGGSDQSGETGPDHRLRDLFGRLPGAKDDSSWIWVHKRLPDGVVVWDAQTTTLRHIAVWRRATGEWEVEPASATIEREEEGQEADTAGVVDLPFETGLISSFCSQLSDIGDSAWPTAVPCELFTFMRRDADWLFPNYDESVSVRSWMARMAPNTAYIQKVAEFLCVRLRTANIERVNAFCTFMPGLSMAGQVHAESVGALTFLSRLACEVSRCGSFGEVGCIVVAAGSVLEHLSWLRHGQIDPGVKDPDASREVTYAKCYDRVSSIRRLVQALMDVRKVVPSAPRMAVELEPGFLSCVGNHAALREFVRQVSPDGIGSGIGLNCDVAHWGVAGIKPGEVDPAVSAAVLHAHISVVGKGHFTDRIPLEGEVEDRVGLLSWLAFLGKTAENGALIDNASLELELADSLTVVHESLSRFRTFVRPMERGDGGGGLVAPKKRADTA